ncbi:unnamed protein product [Hydatigera taeniaeformis]|uniref:Armadillo repeat-containing protein 5 n=1 Tax=Hydatigena taeniaeformis TaxID=6205 RepID=A0A158RDL2_HYDTA|nr:unnamed protein product [Hydatigera taeniaeformis]
MDLSVSTDIPCLINRLNSSNTTVQAAAAACIQHLVYKNDDAKEEAWRAGGLDNLIRLFTSNELSVVANATGALRNLTSGSNIRLCLEFERSNGINALLWLINQYRQSFAEEHFNTNLMAKLNTDRILNLLENASAILCNITSIEIVRKRVAVGAVIPVLLTTVLIPVSRAVCGNLGNFSDGNSPLHPTVLYRTCTAVIRNMSCCEDANIRAQLRGCVGLLENLLQVMRVAGTSGLTDTKVVENCTCAVRNLCFALGDVTKPPSDYFITKALRSRGRCKIAKGWNRKDFDTHIDVGEASKPTSNTLDAVLWRPDAIATLLALLSQSPNPVCIEAAAGAIQNLTSSAKWQPAEIVRSEASIKTLYFKVRLQNGLPVLVDLLHFPDNSVVKTVAMTLRNLILEKETLKHLGKHSLPALVASLTLHSPMPRSPSLSSLTPSPALNVHRCTPLNCQVLLPILILCSEIISNQGDFTSHFVELGGVHYCKAVVQALSAERKSTLSEIHRSCRQVASQLLRSLCKFKRPRSLNKEVNCIITNSFTWFSQQLMDTILTHVNDLLFSSLFSIMYGLTNVDFLQKKRGMLLPTSVHQSRSRHVPMTLAQRYEEGEERQRRRYYQAHSYCPNYDQRKSFRRVPFTAFSPPYHMELFPSTMRWQPEDTPQQFDTPFGVCVPFPSTNTANIGPNAWEVENAAFAMAPWDRSPSDTSRNEEDPEKNISFIHDAMASANGT